MVAGDDYDQTHNLVLKQRDTTFGGQVSCLQVARLMASACRNPEASENMVRSCPVVGKKQRITHVPGSWADQTPSPSPGLAALTVHMPDMSTIRGCVGVCTAARCCRALSASLGRIAVRRVRCGVQCQARDLQAQYILVDMKGETLPCAWASL